MSPEATNTLAPEEAARLTEFARALKAAARAVTLYPNGHPAITVTLSRIAQITSPAGLATPLHIDVLADRLLLDGRAPARPDAGVAELAGPLHAHLIGEMVVHPGGDPDAWRNFLLLLGRSAETVRADGGIARLWTTMAGRHVELREIDYAAVLRERAGGDTATWEQVIANCLQGDATDLTDEAIRRLLDIASESGTLAELIAALDAKATGNGLGTGARTTALMRLLHSIIGVVTDKDPDRLEPVLSNLGTAIAQLSPQMMVSLLAHMGPHQGAAPSLVADVVRHMSDGAIAGFVARHATAEHTAIDRLALAFQTLVQDSDRRERLLSLAHDDAAHSPLGTATGFEEMWDKVAQKLLTSYSDKPFVSEEYGRELTSVRTQAVQVEQVSDDPPERLSSWLGTVATSELRKLDLALVLDLLRIEEDTERWSTLMRPVVSLLEDLFMVGDFEAAETVVGALVHATQPPTAQDRRQTAMTAVDVLVAGPMMRHIVTHLATMDDPQFQRVKTMCVSLGQVLIRPLAEALSAEERSRPRERLTAILLAFGALGRREVERLKGSQNPAVRRTAIYLLREFGGSEALPDLTELLDDKEQGVQREAVRAIVNIGTPDAYKILQQALVNGTARSREAIMQSIGMLRDERAVPLFIYMLQHIDHRGQLRWVYARAIESLGASKDPQSISVLKDALYRGEWWAPRRTSELRAAAAAALVRIDTPDALQVLDEAARGGRRGVRAAARAQLSGGRPSRRMVT